MTGFAGMDKKRRAAGARQGGGDFAANMSRLAHPGHNNPPCAGQAQVTGLDKAVINALGEGRNGIGFNLEGACRGVE